MTIYYIDGYSLTLDQVKAIMADDSAQVKLSDEARERCQKSRNQIERWLEKDAPAVYGINTGLGNLKDVIVPKEMHVEWNKSLPYTSSAGFGPYFSADIARLALLVRANVLARAYSAVRPALIDRILGVFNAHIAPTIHSEGSTGLSDLAPMSQCIMTVAGLPDAGAIYQGQVMPAREALAKAGLSPTFDMECKEVLAQMNGSSVTQAIAVLNMIKFADIYEQYSALNLGDSALIKDKKAAYQSIIDFADSIINKENNISCDNPLLFATENDNYEAIMGCNCSNTQVGYVMDLMNILLAEMGLDILAISNNPDKAEQILADIRTWAGQVSADNIATKANQEDHVEFSFTAAKKMSYSLGLIEQII